MRKNLTLNQQISTLHIMDNNNKRYSITSENPFSLALAFLRLGSNLRLVT